MAFENFKYRYHDPLTQQRLGPDITENYSSNTIGNSGSYDYQKMIKSLMGGAGGNGGFASPQAAGSGWGLRGAGTSPAGYSPMAGGTGGQPRPVSSYDVKRWETDEAIRQQQAATAAAMQMARFNGGITLAQAQMQADLQRQIEAQRIADNEKNRLHQTELARRQQVGDAYGQRMENFYRYGLGEY